MDFDGFPVELIILYIYIKIDEILSPILPKIGFLKVPAILESKA